MCLCNTERIYLDVSVLALLDGLRDDDSDSRVVVHDLKIIMSSFSNTAFSNLNSFINIISLIVIKEFMSSSNCAFLTAILS